MEPQTKASGFNFRVLFTTSPVLVRVRRRQNWAAKQVMNINIAYDQQSLTLEELIKVTWHASCLKLEPL